jgi:tyrosinase
MNMTFTFFDESGHAISLTGRQIVDTVGELNYRYDDDPAAMAHVRPASVEGPTEASPAVQPRRNLAASQTEARIQLSNAPTTVSLPLSETAATQLKAMSEPGARGKIILQLDDIQYEKSRGFYYEVYVNLPQGEKPDFHSANFIGTLTFFALKPHPAPDHEQAVPQKATSDYDISKAVRELSARDSWNPKEMTVTLVPRGLVGHNGEPLPMPSGVEGTLGKITLAAQ